MIATEAAGEGLNLQFCSLVINYDLPWNPQRIEQRIGRCHRYGQRFDVVVVNFINLRNFADVRVFNLLNDKFNLFVGVFGASDDVLGIADNIDIESRILEIYQQCRTEDEINEAFERLQKDMSAVIDKRMEATRDQVLKNFDINVQEHLRTRQNDTGAFLNRYQHIFWELTKFVLSSAAVFDDDTHTFTLKAPVAGQRVGRYALLSTDTDASPYRLNDTLAQHVINTALSYNLSQCADVTFDESALAMNAGLPEYMQGESGYLVLGNLSVSSFEDERYALFTAFTESGKPISQEDCEKLFLNGGCENGTYDLPQGIADSLDRNFAQHAKAKLSVIDSRNLDFIRQEEDRIFAWENDMLKVLGDEIDTVKSAIRQAERNARQATSLQEKLECERKVDDLSRKRRRLHNELNEKEDEVRKKRKAMMEELDKRIIQSSNTDRVFTIHWTIK